MTPAPPATNTRMTVTFPAELVFFATRDQTATASCDIRRNGETGGVIAACQLGYGVAAFGVGPLTSAGVRLPVLFGASAVVAAGMGLLSLLVAHRRPSPATAHPRPGPPRPFPAASADQAGA
jgi:hypothetical protein